MTKETRALIDEYIARQHNMYKVCKTPETSFRYEQRILGYLSCLCDLDMISADEKSIEYETACDKI